ncbi:MAG: 3'(2'),5'-bisphosphate nucleotidase CysQ [Bdellovibrionales bacterium]|nr:3'(2'),5'-bisphosphate nucleotidase CysQ [Bdellovibrionales bacterium]
MADDSASKGLGARHRADYQQAAGELRAAVGDLELFYEKVAAAVEAAGRAILDEVARCGMRRVQLSAEQKGDGSPVSQADRAAHAVLEKCLGGMSPFRVISEEDPNGVPNETEVLEQLGGGFFWLADPLDGTRDFIAGEETFAVSLALMRVYEKEGKRHVYPWAGCIGDPSHQLSWLAARERRGRLTKRQEGREIELPMAETKVSDVRETGLREEGALRVLGSRSIPSDRLKAVYEFWGVERVMQMGSALKFALIAEGSYDVYPRFGPTSEWDIAAGQLLLEETGGALVDLSSGRPMEYGKPQWQNPGFLAAGSRELAQKWLPLLRVHLGVHEN